MTKFETGGKPHVIKRYFTQSDCSTSCHVSCSPRTHSCLVHLPSRNRPVKTGLVLSSLFSLFAISNMFCKSLLVYICFLSLHHSVFTDNAKDEEGVLILNKNNFEKTLAENEHILVDFYAPWCGHCKTLEPQFIKAASILTGKNSKIKLAKVDATEETELAEQHNVKGYPTLKFFRKGTASDYSGGRQADDIVNWLIKKTGPPARSLSSVDDVKSFIDSNNVAIVGFFSDKDSSGASNFITVADKVDDQQFGIVTDPSLFTEFNARDGEVIMFKKFDDESSHYDGPDDVESLQKFVASEALPYVVEFNHETAAKVFGGQIKKHLLMFISKKAGNDKLFESLKPISKKFRSELLFVSINTDEPEHQRILEYFGLKESEIPTMRIIHLEEDMAKYKPEKPEIEAENVKSFITAFLDGKLKEHLLAQDLPDDWDKHPVKTLVSSNFDQVVFDKEKDVLVEFYAPWCGHCKQFSPIYEKLAESFKDKDDLVIAKMDATANELEHSKISNYPTLKLYTKGAKEVIQYNGERTLEGLTKFLESGGEYGQAPPTQDEGVEEDEDDDLPRKDEL